MKKKELCDKFSALLKRLDLLAYNWAVFFHVICKILNHDVGVKVLKALLMNFIDLFDMNMSQQSNYFEAA